MTDWGVKGKDRSEDKNKQYKKIYFLNKEKGRQGLRLCLPPASPSTVGCVGE